MAAPAPDLSATATVATARADRWAKQLAAHLGRKAEVRDTADGPLLLLGGGSCLLAGGSTALRLHAAAPDEDALARVQAVVGGHLERFSAATESLTVVWQRA